MSSHFSREQIFAGVREDLSTCLGIEPEEVSWEANFFRDLGGESIDMLDLGFRSEKRFKVRSPFPRLTAREGWQFSADGKLSIETLQRLQSEFPQIDWTTRFEKLSIQDVRDVVSIDLIVELLYFAQFENAARETTASS